MEDTALSFDIGLKSNKETNDFLRCLWARMKDIFSNLGWLYSPFKIDNTIYVGKVSIEDNIELDIRLGYKQRGCLSTITFVPCGSFDHQGLKKRLKKCVDDSLRYKDFIHRTQFSTCLDKNLSFRSYKGDNYSLEGNMLSLFVDGFDEVDQKSLFKSHLHQVCDFLSFDTLRFIAPSGTPIEEIREKHNDIIRIVDANNGEVIDEREKNDIYKNLVVSDCIAKYIDSYLMRPFMYETHLNNFDKSVRFFAQGIRNEELSRLSVGLPEPYTEQAIVNYMSALEIITLDDIPSENCSCCGQPKYSISRRVKDLAENALPDGRKFADRYYSYRSGYVHSGYLLSSNNYFKRSIPLMSEKSENGMIDQISLLSEISKEDVKKCIIWHEKEWYH